MPAAYDFVLDGVFSHVEDGRAHFVAPSGHELVVPATGELIQGFDSQTIFALSEVYWNRIGCPVTYTRHRNVGEQW